MTSPCRCMRALNQSQVAKHDNHVLVTALTSWRPPVMLVQWRPYREVMLEKCKNYVQMEATKVGSPPNCPKLISQLRGIPQPQYFVPSLLEPYWTYLWKHYIYHKKDTKVGSQILDTKFGFVPDCLYILYEIALTQVCYPLTQPNFHSHWRVGER